MRATEPSNKIFYKGKSDDFIIFVEDTATLNNWKNDSSVPLADVVNGWKIFVTHRHGSQGVLDGASRASLENEFGTANDEECVKKILQGGELQGYSQRERGGDTNVRNGMAI
ncbi:ribosome maturation protein [Aspergillus cavernicola]|uniref:Ribosome maturation protein n=1 Tax=Aspergillus cavernicola TaxID=176166 RepID=A0ABR4HIM5_9EURO